MFNLCAQNAHSALGHGVPGREPHQAVGSEHVRSAPCPCAAGAARPALMAEPHLLHTAFPSRKLLCARVRSRATAWFEHSPQMQCQVPAAGHQARETDSAPSTTRDEHLQLPPAAFQEGNCVVNTPSPSLSKDNGRRLEHKKAWEATSLTSHIWETQLEISGSPHNNSVNSS